MSGLSVSTRYDFLMTAPVVRAMAIFTNSTGLPITVDAALYSTLGSNLAKTIQATSSGDLIVTDADRYFISTDVGPSDLVNTIVRFGPGASLPPAGSVLPATGLDELRDHHSLTVPAGRTRRLMSFGRVGLTVADATGAVGTFDTTASMEAAGYLNGMTTQERSEVVNFDLTTPPEPVPTLSEWAMILLGLMLAGGAALHLQRRLTA